MKKEQELKRIAAKFLELIASEEELKEEPLAWWFMDVLKRRRNNEAPSDKVEKEIRDVLDKYKIKC